MRHPDMNPAHTYINVRIYMSIRSRIEVGDQRLSLKDKVAIMYYA